MNLSLTDTLLTLADYWSLGVAVLGLAVTAWSVLRTWQIYAPTDRTGGTPTA